MRAWQTESGHLVCHWSEVGQSMQRPRWMDDTPYVQSGYLPPLPDFASHSPFAGASWFQIHWPERDSELNCE